MLKHSFSDFSYAVNIESAKKGHKEVLVCFIYNGVEVLKKVYIPEKAGTAYILEAKKIIDQEMRDGSLAIYSHKFINRNKRKKIQPKKVVAAAAKGEKVSTSPTPNGNKKWVIATVVVAAIAVALAATTIVFATKGGSEPQPQPVVTTCNIVFNTSGEHIVYDKDLKTVDYKAPLKTEISIDSSYRSNFEICNEDIKIYMSKDKLNEGTDFTFVKKARGVYELNIDKVTDTVYINVSSIERCLPEGFDYETVEGGEKIKGIKTNNKEQLTEIEFPSVHDGKNIVAIEPGILQNCSSLRKLTIPFVGLNKDATQLEPEEMTEESKGEHLFGSLFGDKVFVNAEALTYQEYWDYRVTELDPPQAPTHIYKKFAIPNTLKEITLTGLNDIHVHTDDEEMTEAVKGIPMGAFSNCAYINKINVVCNDNSLSIDKNALSNCRSLSSFAITSSKSSNSRNEINNISIGNSAFEGCGILLSFDFTNVQAIGNNAFNNCSSLGSIYLPDVIADMGDGAFASCSCIIKCQYTEIEVKDNWGTDWSDPTSPIIYGVTEEEKEVEPIYDNDNKFSCLVTQSAVYIVQYLGDLKDSQEIIIPNELKFGGSDIGRAVTHIGSESFMDFNETESIKIECQSLVSIGAEAFKNCKALKEVSFDGGAPENITTIGVEAFKGCPLLTSKLEFKGVTSVGAGAFYGDASLTSIKFNNVDAPNKTVTFGRDAFRDCTLLATIDYTVAYDAVGYVIPDYCFYGTAIRDINIPQSTIEVGTAAFAYCQSAQTLQFLGTDEIEDDNNVVTIGDSAFLRCTHLNYSGSAELGDEIYLPGGLSSIGRAAFQDCFHIEGITCRGTEFTEIPDSMCYGTSSLRHFHYNVSEAKYTKIGQFAFAQDQHFRELGDNTNALPKTLEEIGDRAFINAISLGRYRNGTKYSEPLHIQYDTDKQPKAFKMGEQVFYGWYDSYSLSKTTCDCNRLNIDAGWLNQLKSTKKPEGWNWKIETASTIYDYYDQTVEGWGGAVWINVPDPS